MGRIEMDFHKSMQQAQQLEQIAERLKRLVQQNLDIVLYNISVNWRSENSDKFCQKGQTIRSQIIRTARDIDNTAGNIRIIARAAYDAEKKAEEIAGRRNRNG